MDNNEKRVIEKIREEYSEKKQSVSKLEKLKKLDSKVKTPALAFGYSFGTAGALILGTGMCLAMNVIGGTLGWMIAGIAIGLVGIAMVSLTPVLFNKMLKKRKAKFASEIVSISNDILTAESKEENV